MFQYYRDNVFYSTKVFIFVVKLTRSRYVEGESRFRTDFVPGTVYKTYIADMSHFSIKTW